MHSLSQTVGRDQEQTYASGAFGHKDWTITHNERPKVLNKLICVGLLGTVVTHWPCDPEVGGSNLSSD